ncbi:hypothetical protein GCM10009416_48920 [Craurococcus roseus]|uniref:Uncharacterized protein n=1 Tax=Craurococcus roseus TaxID=77585 RepID=A0ABN1G7M6_9PROT
MAKIDTLLPGAGTARAEDEAGPPVDAVAAVPPAAAPTAPVPLAAFRGGRSEVDRTADLLAFAIASERGLAPTPDGVERARREADAALGDYCIRHLHNNVEQIRQEAVAAHLGSLRPPPSFAALVLANLVALAAAGALGAWLWTRPDIRATVAGLLGG